MKFQPHVLLISCMTYGMILFRGNFFFVHLRIIKTSEEKVTANVHDTKTLNLVISSSNRHIPF